MSGMVIKQWYPNARTPDESGAYVKIIGREGGVVGFTLALLGVDPTVTLSITSLRAEFRTASLSGSDNRMIPLEKLSSTYHGYYRPWREAATIFGLFFVGGVGVSASQSNGGFGVFFVAVISLVGVVLAIICYLLNQTLTVGLVEVAGIVSGMKVKKSVIEGIDINDKTARLVCEITEKLVERARSTYMPSVPAVYCTKCGAANPGGKLGQACASCGSNLN